MIIPQNIIIFVSRRRNRWPYILYLSVYRCQIQIEIVYIFLAGLFNYFKKKKINNQLNSNISSKDKNNLKLLITEYAIIDF